MAGVRARARHCVLLSAMWSRGYRTMCRGGWLREGMRHRLHSYVPETNSAQRGKYPSTWRRTITNSGGNEAGKDSEEVVKLITESPRGPPQSARAIRGGPVSWISLGLLMVTGGGLIAYWDREKRRQLKVITSDAPAEAKHGPGVGKAAIGGPFKLVNQDGKVVTDRDFVGNWNLIYFGFTYCPDICPDELTKMAEAIDKIEKESGLQVVPVFISIDPERDTVEQIRDYLKEFHPRLVGLTGSVDDIRQVAREYRVYYMKTEDEGDDYLVDHSIIMYLMDPNMDFVKFFGKNYTADSLAHGVIEEMKNVKEEKTGVLMRTLNLLGTYFKTHVPSTQLATLQEELKQEFEARIVTECANKVRTPEFKGNVTQ